VIRPPRFSYWEVYLDGYCYILCADGYAEEAVQVAEMALAGKGLPTAFLGLKAGWIRGGAGGLVSAEVLISQVKGEGGTRPLPDALLLAGGTVCGQYMLADPRVHILVQNMLAAARPVGLLGPVCYQLFDLLAKRAGGSPFLRQESQTTASFVDTFVRCFHETGQARQSPSRRRLALHEE